MYKYLFFLVLFSLSLCKISEGQKTKNNFVISTSTGYGLLDDHNAFAIDIDLGYNVKKLGFGLNYTVLNAEFEENPITGYNAGSTITFTDIYFETLTDYYHRNTQIIHNVLSPYFSYILIDKEKILLNSTVGLSFYRYRELDLVINSGESAGIPLSTYTRDLDRRLGWNADISLYFKLNSELLIGIKNKYLSTLDNNLAIMFSVQARIPSK